MQSQKQCPECASRNLYLSDNVSAVGGYGPDLLPGLGKFLSNPKFSAILCADCGLTRYYANKDTLARLGQTTKWRKLS